MARYFDEDEEREFAEPGHDTEVTLSWGGLTGIGIALLLICGLCFGLGYMVGRHGPAPRSASASSPAASAPDQEPLQGSSSVPKPSASAQAPAPPAAETTDTASAPGGSDSPEPVASSPAQGGQSGATGGTGQATSAQQQPPVRSALPNYAAENAPGGTGAGVRPALPSATSPMVQVAAVKNDEDASVLTTALRRRGYPVTARRDPEDGLIHVRIGPFPTRDEANQWRMKLLNDGYNAIVQP